MIVQGKALKEKGIIFLFGIFLILVSNTYRKNKFIYSEYPTKKPNNRDRVGTGSAIALQTLPLCTFFNWIF